MLTTRAPIKFGSIPVGQRIAFSLSAPLADIKIVPLACDARVADIHNDVFHCGTDFMTFFNIISEDGKHAHVCPDRMVLVVMVWDDAVEGFVLEPAREWPEVAA